MPRSKTFHNEEDVLHFKGGGGIYLWGHPTYTAQHKIEMAREWAKREGKSWRFPRAMSRWSPQDFARVWWLRCRDLNRYLAAGGNPPAYSEEQLEGWLWEAEYAGLRIVRPSQDLN